MIIAIDGPAASGKGTLARRLAKHFGLAYLDTGLIYRAVGAKTLQTGHDPNDAVQATASAKALTPVDLERDDLRGEAAASAASKVAAIPGVRAALLAFQRQFAATPPGAVLDGRDIGTVICPDADAKLYLLASAEVRAARRAEELRRRGGEAIYAAVLRDLRERDERDSGRDIAPLQPATDAIRLDTDDLDADQVFEIAVEAVGQMAGDRKVKTAEVADRA
jgi:cytidylate kinase